jgi:pimeloyl-[acyl-carrier protein] methyl ester esterase
MLRGRCQLSDGRQLAWRETGAGPVVVLIHGWTLSGAVFHEMAALLGRDHRVLMPDLPGHGGSSPASDISLEKMAADLRSWFDLVAPAPHLVCGWSLGGMVALNLAAEAGLRPKGLVLMATTPRFTNTQDWSFGLPASEVRLLDRNLGRDFKKTLGQFFTRMFAGECMAPERLRTIRKFAIYNQALPEPSAARGLLKVFSDQDQRGLLKDVVCPALVIHGTDDQITPAGAGRFLADTVAQSSLVEYPATGHAPFLSRPSEVASAIRSFQQWCR